MTEFRKASAAVETIEKLTEDLKQGATLAAGGHLSNELHSCWVETQKHLSELSPLAEKMQRRCDARAQLESIKEELRASIPGAPEDCIKQAQEMVDTKAAGYEQMQGMLSKALELEAIATYGVKMAEKVSGVLTRLSVAKETLQTMTPVFQPLVSQLDEKVAAAQAERQKQEAAANEAAAREAAEAARKPLEELMEENQKKWQAQQAAEEAARLKQEEELRAEQQKELNRLAAEDALLRMEKESDAKVAKLGANAACAEALSSMLAASVGAYRGIIEGLEAMISAIAAEPADVRLRVIRVRNEDFQERLGRQPGVWLFLRAVGFQQMTREDLPGDLVSALSLSSSPPTERFLLLMEPDMMNAYDEWSKWHQRLRAVASFLQDLGKLAFHRIAHLGRHGQDLVVGEILSAKELLAAWHSSVPS
ncbi:unnamed protein product [Durusdinium trenchii]|uniref:Uncharacterized protein n=2 Tax=Durusdinium trenchii TaxID=1381693 RepID=A0ABP0J5P0_9DINO